MYFFLLLPIRNVLNKCDISYCTYLLQLGRISISPFLANSISFSSERKNAFFYFSTFLVLDQTGGYNWYLRPLSSRHNKAWDHFSTSIFQNKIFEFFGQLAYPLAWPSLCRINLEGFKIKVLCIINCIFISYNFTWKV